MKHLQDTHVLILGLGASGLAMARWCARHGAHVTVADTREAPPQLAALRAELPGATFIGGPFSAALVEGTPVRAVYRSPGLAPQTVAPVVEAARAIGLPVGGELDLFSQALADLRADTAQQSAAVPPEPEAPVIAAIAMDSQTPASHDDDNDDDDDTDADRPVPAPVAPPRDTGYAPVVIAITGTNGKTTTTSMTGQLVERAGKTVAVAGNIGPTLLDTLAARIDAKDLPQVWVLELSSFQLDGVQHFEPTAATVLNVTQDHLDWHGDMDGYAAAKARIFGTSGLMVLNRDDPRVIAMADGAGPSQASRSGGATAKRAPAARPKQRPRQRPYITFGAGLPQRPGDYGIEQVNGMAWLVRAYETDETRKRGAAAQKEEIFLQRLMPADALRIHGRHNALNALAALALASAAGCRLASTLYGLREYRGQPHRVEPVAIVNEVEYFDDSKGTNVGATIAALNGLGVDRRIVVILGGEGKGQDFAPLAEPVRRHARAVVLIGRDAPLIEAALAGAGVSMERAGSMQDAVTRAARRAHPGDAVLLSPACASFDMFDDYAHRAAVFCEAVQVLADDASVAIGGQA